MNADGAGIALAARSPRRGVRSHLVEHARMLNAIAFLLVLLAIFAAVRPDIFLSWRIYYSVFSVLPVSIILVVPLVFIVAAGEIDLSFPSTFGLAALAFTLAVAGGLSPWVGLLAALAAGAAIGLLNGVLVTRIGLSSLVATLGMNFAVRGVVLVVAAGNSISLAQLRRTGFHTAFVGAPGELPTQMIWGLGFAAIALALFARHRFGAHVRAVGDNALAAREMGIDVAGVRTATFIYMGLAAGLAGALSTTINLNFFPTSGDGYLLPVLAALFVGGTPTWGGVGTVAGAVFGAATVGFIESGIITVGLTGFYTQLCYGLVVILSLIGHRFARARRRAA